MEPHQIQGSEKWHAYRRNHIGSSDVPCLMGFNQWKTIEQLWEEKVNGIDSVVDNPWMKRGREMEEPARKLYEFFTDRCVVPTVLEHPHYKFMSASFDGLSPFSNFAVEIKVPGKVDHQKALDGQIPDKYYPQLQHQMFVANLDNMDYFSWNGDTHALINVKRNQEYIVKMVEREIVFWNFVQEKTRPTNEFVNYCQVEVAR